MNDQTANHPNSSTNNHLLIQDDNLLIEHCILNNEANDTQQEFDPEFFLNAASDPETPESTEPGATIIFRSPNKNDPSEPLFDAISKDLAPITIAVCKEINQNKGRYVLKALFDSGSTMAAMINHRAIPKDVKTATLPKTVNVNTTQGTLSAREAVTLGKLYLPAFSGTRYIGQIQALVFDAPNVRYDLILGRNFLRQLGMILDFNSLCVTWKDFGTIPFQPPSSFNDAEYVKQLLQYHPAKVQQSIENGALVDSFAHVRYSRLYKQTKSRSTAQATT